MSGRGDSPATVEWTCLSQSRPTGRLTAKGPYTDERNKMLSPTNPTPPPAHDPAATSSDDGRPTWGWAGSVEAFLSVSPEAWHQSMRMHHIALCGSQPSASQVAAWGEEGKIMRATLRDICVAQPSATRWGIAFEYELPLENGRRPDVVVLAGRTVVVLEFKQQSEPSAAAIDQVRAYARDLAEYHEQSHGLVVVPVLVLTGASHPYHNDDLEIADPASVAGVLLDHASTDGQIDIDSWLTSVYAPLPTLIAAARRIFQHEPLPAIKRALSTGIPEAVALLGDLAERAAADNDRVLAFIAGVPGSGKTLAGLSLVYERTAKMSAATFLSGNGPLVEVLRDALKSKAFVRDLHAFIKTYGLSNRVPNEHVIVFDEAQRAWDRGYMAFKHSVDRSEPELLIQVGERLPGWATLVGLVGDGQEIHAGEEAGIEQWREAASPPLATKTWRVHCPPRLAHAFKGMDVTAHDVLDLTISLRSRRADRLHDWVHALLEGNLAFAARHALRVQAEAFPLYLTRDLDEAKAYVRSRYAGAEEKRYGLLASSRTQSFLPKYGVDTSWPATKRVKLARWYNEPAGHPQSCCALEDVVTEFGCQGLELDFPIVCWGDDLVWDGQQWNVKPVRSKYPLDDHEQLRRNAYRVLLTRGRDGLVVFVPPAAKLDLTEHALLAAGVRPLPAALEAVKEA